jgi:hypothetical protein
MTVSITYYGANNQFWNAGPSSGDVTAKDILVNTSSNSNVINFTLSLPSITFTGTVKGSFAFDGPISTLDKVSGTLTEVTAYLNGFINEYTVIPQGTDMLSWILGSTTVAKYITTASTLNRGVTFVGSQGGQEYGDTLIAGTGKDSFTSYGGKITKPNQAAYFDGEGNLDLAILQGKLADYKVQNTTFTDQTDMSYKAKVSGWQLIDSVTSRNGTTQVVNVERLKFSDTMLALDTGKDQTTGSGYMLYKAAFNRTPDAGGLGYWISQMDKGMVYSDVAKNFVNSTEFQTAFGGSNPTVNTLVTKLYNNVLNRTPDTGGLAFWQEKLTTGWSTADVLGYFSTSGENVTNVTPLIANGIQYQQFVG